MTQITTSSAANNDINTYYYIGRLIFLIINFSPLDFEPLQEPPTFQETLKSFMKDNMHRFVKAGDGSTFLDKATTFTVTFLNASFNIASVNSTIC
jgi:hypothetical protein